MKKTVKFIRRLRSHIFQSAQLQCPRIFGPYVLTHANGSVRSVPPKPQSAAQYYVSLTYELIRGTADKQTCPNGNSVQAECMAVWKRLPAYQKWPCQLLERVGRFNYGLMHKKFQLPSRPSGAYGMYCKENFQSVYQNNPGIGVKETMRLVARNWKVLTIEQKQKYRDRADQGRVQYYKLCEKAPDHTVNIVHDHTVRKSRRKWEKLTTSIVQKGNRGVESGRNSKLSRYRIRAQYGKPTAPRNAYAVFVSDSLRNHSGSASKEAKVLGLRWAALPAEAKAEYQRKLRTLRAAYALELAEWKRKMIQAGHDGELIKTLLTPCSANPYQKKKHRREVCKKRKRILAELIQSRRNL